ncbi:hypothetical protein BJ165DRAFT_1497337 [Panaeolus papilionaceus]|nr:hypothetical protein BJ165DRAFT_1497337 [Panaeolus papilionaceus]
MYSFEQRPEANNDIEEEEEEEERRRRETKLRTNALLNPYAGDKEDEVDPKTFTYKQYFKKPERFTGGPYTVYQPPQVQQKAPVEGQGVPEDVNPSTLQQWVAGVRQAQKGAQVQGMEMSPFVQFPAGAMGIGSLLGGGEGRPSPMPLERMDTPPLSEGEQAANEAFSNGRRGLMPPPNGRPNGTLNGVNGNGNASVVTPGRGRGLTRSYTNEGMPGGPYAGRGEMPVWGVAPSPTPRSNTPVQAQASATPLKRQAKPLGKTTTLASIPVDPNASFRVPVTRSMAGREMPVVQSVNGKEKEKAIEMPDDGADTESEGDDTEAED